MDKRPVILYDGVCNMCNGGVNRVLDCDTQGVFRLAALQSGPGRQLLARCGRSPDDLSSIVLVEEHSHYTKSEAVLRIASRLNMPLAVLVPGLSSLLPRPLLDAAYDQVRGFSRGWLGLSVSKEPLFWVLLVHSEVSPRWLRASPLLALDGCCQRCLLLWMRACLPACLPPDRCQPLQRAGPH